MLSPHTLPELDASVLLNDTAYTKDIGNSRSRNAASVGFSKAKRDLRELIHRELLGDPQLSSSERKCNNKGTAVKNLYILRGHGVPNHLLQHLVVAADRWLHDKSALELWVDSSCQGSLSVFTTQGASWRTLFPTEWDDDVALYLAAMKRIVSGVGTMTPFCYGQSILPGELEWKVSISRNNKLPLTLFPNVPEVFPVIEWVVPPPSQPTSADIDMETINFSNSYVPYNNVTTSNAPSIGKILIRMQGATNPIFPQGQDYLKQQHDVSLIFEASFETKYTMLPY